MVFQKKRWFYLSVAFVIEMIVGLSYIWSVFAAPIAIKYGWMQKELTFAFTLGTIVTTLTSILLGSKMSKKFSTKQIIMMGALFFGGGTLLGGLFLHNTTAFYFFQSILRGMGSAFVYPVLVAYSQQLYPEKTGFGSGVTTAGFGAGGIVWAPIANYLLSIYDINTTLVIIGIVTGLLIFVLSFFLEKPTDEFKSNMAHIASTNKKIEKSVGDKKTKQMLKDPLFYFFFFVLCFGLAGGSMIISQARQILAFQYGNIYGATTIASIVSLISAGGALGRFFFGFISDKLGRMRSLLFASILAFVCAFLLAFVTIPELFVGLLILIVLVYGGYSSMIAPFTGYLFGVKNIPLNYPVVFGAFGVASIIGPMSTSALFDHDNNYQNAFLVAMVIAGLALLFTLIIIYFVHKRNNKNTLSTGNH